MKKAYLSFLGIAVYFLACNEQTSLKSRTIIIDKATGDTTIVVKKNSIDTFLIYREVEIVENQNNDTLLLGYSIVPPGFTGKITFIQQNLNPSQAVYLDSRQKPAVENTSSYSTLFTILNFGSPGVRE